MATTKIAPDACIDTELDYISASDEYYICSGSSSPTTRAAAIAAALVTISLSSGDFTKADDAVSPYGRKVTIAAKTAEAIDVTGDATCVVLCKNSDATLRYVTTCTTQNITSGGTIDLPAWKVQVGDPT